MSWATDGQDGNGLELKKIGPVFSRLSPCVLENSLRLTFWLNIFVCFHQKCTKYYLLSAFSWPIFHS